MTKPTVFIGSSRENADVAKAIEVNLSGEAEVSIWPLSFTPGQSVYHELMRLRHNFDFAILIMTPDDAIVSRGIEASATRDNVIFELGLFLGSIGPERVFAVTDSERQARVMADYAGVVHLSYDSDRTDHSLIKALSPVTTQIVDAIRKLGRVSAEQDVTSTLFPGGMIGLEKVYDSFDAARSYIYDDLKATAGPIRVFIHIASQDVGLKGTFFDVLDQVVRKGTVDVRVLHAAPDSPLFAKNRLISLGKNYDRVLSSLDYAAASLKALESAEGSSLRRRSHSLPFIWRLYSVFERLYLMPYFSDKDAVKSSPVLVFGRRENSLYHVFKDWFDHAWEASSPERVQLSDIVAPATPAGTALFLKWNGAHVFGIPRRDVRANPARVRFYGIGGKRESGAESFEDCALREGNEELPGAITGLTNAEKTTYVRSDGTMRTVIIYGSTVTPRLILEKADHSGLGIMPSNADDYMLVAYEGQLDREPKPSSELGAVVLMPDHCLRLFLDQSTVTVADVEQAGGQIIKQADVPIADQTILVPHGTAMFTIRTLVS